VLVSNPSAFHLRFGPAVQEAGSYSGRLSNGGDSLRLIDSTNETIFNVVYDDQLGWPAAADGDGASLQLHDLMTDPSQPEAWTAAEPTPGLYLVGASAELIGVWPFYDGSKWDGNQPGPGGNSAAATAVDKSVAVPDQPVTADNILSAPEGIVGLMIDIANLPAAAISSADLRFRKGTSADPETWSTAPGPIPLSATSVARGAGAEGSDRITLFWQPGSLVNTWLEVTILPTPQTGLAVPVVFYLGSLVGDTANDAGPFIVDSTDFDRVRANPRNFLNPAAIDSMFDVTRDGFVDGSDLASVRDAMGASLPALM
jgi:hypothetical protein